jgi:hypothetical protein
MRSISLSLTISLVLLSSAALAQQPTGTTGDKLTVSPPPAPPAATSTPQASQPARGSATFTPAELPPVYTGSGRDVAGPDDTTKVVKAVPCSTAARGTDGTTTCIGIPDQSPERRRR